MKILIQNPTIRIKPPLTSENTGLYGEQLCIPLAVRGRKVQPLNLGAAPDTIYEISRAMRQGADVIVLRGRLDGESLQIDSADLHVQPEKTAQTEQAARHPAMLGRLKELGEALLESHFGYTEADPDFQVSRDDEQVLLSALGSSETHRPAAALSVAARLTEKRPSEIYGELGTLTLLPGKDGCLITNDQSGETLNLSRQQVRTLAHQLRVAALFPERLTPPLPEHEEREESSFSSWG